MWHVTAPRFLLFSLSSFLLLVLGFKVGNQGFHVRSGFGVYECAQLTNNGIPV